MTDYYKKQRIWIFLLIVSCLLFFSCRQIDVYEKNIRFSKHEWQSKDTARGSFLIKDTTAYYNLYIVLRHTDAYQYNNIWLNVGIKAPGDSMLFQKLALTLGSDAAGWEGTGMNDIWEVRKRINARPQRFKKSGIYEFSLVNIMRDDPLPHVMSAGMRVEKSTGQ